MKVCGGFQPDQSDKDTRKADRRSQKSSCAYQEHKNHSEDTVYGHLSPGCPGILSGTPYDPPVHTVAAGQGGTCPKDQAQAVGKPVRYDKESDSLKNQAVNHTSDHQIDLGFPKFRICHLPHLLRLCLLPDSAGHQSKNPYPDSPRTIRQNREPVGSLPDSSGW